MHKKDPSEKAHLLAGSETSLPIPQQEGEKSNRKGEKREQWVWGKKDQTCIYIYADTHIYIYLFLNIYRKKMDKRADST